MFERAVRRELLIDNRSVRFRPGVFDDFMLKKIFKQYGADVPI